ncbi:dethiobiotin synthase [Uliginosibacterium sp. H1]|uniref:dethiobiotin synthase n=1 Tax=Uliginosibacterium sp. H1 TaxID=3114757 RepID=UPI002E197825|nr:dethiobiotin synthase [Uliginosibacterium sp. H1]
MKTTPFSMNAPARAFFITGTDTEIGKTFTTCALLQRWQQDGLRCVGYKPVAAGATLVDGQWVNEDAAQLLAASSPGFSLADINPLCLQAPMAPHLAARREGHRIDTDALLAGFESLRRRADVVLVEGVGGFIVPLDDETDTAEFARRLGLPVILVVGLRLGCINHALLTVEAIAHRGLKLAGWIANTVDPHMTGLTDNIATLEARIAAPRLGTLPRLDMTNATRAALLLTEPVMTAVLNSPQSS